MKKIWMTAFFFALAGFAAGVYLLHTHPGLIAPKKEAKKSSVLPGPHEPGDDIPYSQKSAGRHGLCSGV
ncbi:MAG: hypothetical protein KJ737_02845 [Proteobacteria bacterium]|nr:hypothetical protein [Pseudomonadota bacterium]